MRTSWLPTLSFGAINYFIMLSTIKKSLILWKHLDGEWFEYGKVISERILMDVSLES